MVCLTNRLALFNACDASFAHASNSSLKVAPRASAEVQPGTSFTTESTGRVGRLHGLIQSPIIHLIPRQRIPRQRVLRPRFRRRFIRISARARSLSRSAHKSPAAGVRIHKFRPMFQRQLVTLPRHLSNPLGVRLRTSRRCRTARVGNFVSSSALGGLNTPNASGRAAFAGTSSPRCSRGRCPEL